MKQFIRKNLIREIQYSTLFHSLGLELFKFIPKKRYIAKAMFFKINISKMKLLVLINFFTKSMFI